MIRSEFCTTKLEKFSLLTNEVQGLSEGTLLFFHATGFNAFTYNQLLELLDNKLENRFKIIALDQRGHGLTCVKASPKELTSWDYFVDDALELVDSIDGPIVCMGHSMGAIIAAKVASLRTGKVKKLIMIEPVLWSPFQSFKFKLLKIIPFLNTKSNSMVGGAAKRRSKFADLEKATDSYIGKGAFSTWDRQWISDYLTGGTKPREGNGIELTCSPAWESKTFQTASMDTWKYLKTIKVDCYVPCGDLGSTFSNEARVALKKLGKNWNLENFKGSSHFLPMEFSNALIDRIHSFVSK